MKTDSRKKASSASIASGAPKISPTNAGVLRPVHAKLELLHDAGDHPHGKVDDEELPPEFGHAFIDFVSSLHIQRFHDGDDDGKPQRQRDEEEMVHSCEGKLHTRQNKLGPYNISFVT